MEAINKSEVTMKSTRDARPAGGLTTMAEVQAAIEQWRAKRRRLHQRNMPEPLWQAAVRLRGRNKRAEILRVLGIRARGFDSRIRLAEKEEKLRRRRRAKLRGNGFPGRFVELPNPGASSLCAEPSVLSVVVERGGAPGVRVSISGARAGDLFVILDRLMSDSSVSNLQTGVNPSC